MSEFGGLQLLPQTRRKIELSTPGANSKLYVGLGMLVLVLVVYVGLVSRVRSQETTMTQLNTDAVQLEKSRDKNAEAHLLALSKQTSLMGKLLSDHILWTQAVTDFQALLEPQVQVLNFSGDVTTGVIDFSAKARDFSTVARQIAAFTANDAVKDVRFGTLQQDAQGGISFDTNLTVDVAKFFRKPVVTPGK